MAMIPAVTANIAPYTVSLGSPPPRHLEPQRGDKTRFGDHDVPFPIYGVQSFAATPWTFLRLHPSSQISLF
jgi:hypothetical protein